MAKQRNITTRARETLHIEAPGCIVNITTGMRDDGGHEVTHVSIDADGDRYAGDPEWWCLHSSRPTAKGTAVRVVKGIARPG